MRHTTQLLAAAAATLLLAFSASAADKPPFPRLAGVNNGSPHNYDDPAYQAKLAKLDFSCSPLDRLGQTYGMTMEQVVRNIKAINPGSKVFLYENSMEVAEDNAAAAVVFNKVDQMKWWAFSRGGTATRCCHRSARQSRSRTTCQQHLVHAARQLRLPDVGVARALGRAAVLQAESVDRRLLRRQRVLAAAHRRGLEPRRRHRSEGLAAGRQVAARSLSQALRAVRTT